MKKIILPVIVSMCLVFLGIPNVFAQDVYYINSKNVEMTQEQYSKLAEVFSEQLIEDIPQSEFDIIINEEFVSAKCESKYFLDTVLENNLGEVISHFSQEITEEEYLERENLVGEESLVTPLASGTVTTSMKHINLSVVKTDSSNVLMDLVVDWSSVPKTKSYDVIAVRWGLYSNSTFNVVHYFGTQNAGTPDGLLTQDYSYGGANSKQLSNGVGISMNIFDDAEDTLYNRLYVRGTLNGTMDVTGTLQHATSTVTLAQSQSYTFSSSGLGGVLYYSNSTIRNKYDNTPGITLSI